MKKTPPRFYPTRVFPSLPYIPGTGMPHPARVTNDPTVPNEKLSADRWRENAGYLYGIDLFNHGFYWEAHEAWEAIWHQYGRRGPQADFIKGLIHLAASGVKILERRFEGVRVHTIRAAQCFEEAHKILQGSCYMGLSWVELIGNAEILRKENIFEALPFQLLPK